jgi:hypothetical protein
MIDAISRQAFIGGTPFLREFDAWQLICLKR